MNLQVNQEQGAMTAFEEWAGRKLIAGIVLGAIVLGLGQGFIPVYAQESSPESTSSESTSSESSTSSTEGTPADNGSGGQGGEGEPGAQESETAPEDTSSEDTTVTDTGSEGDNGDTGETGESPADPETPPSDGDPSIIDTGDAHSDSTADTSANTTNVDTVAGTSTEQESDQNSGGSGSSEDPFEVDTEVDNTLLATTTASSTADTGNNAASDSDGVGIFSGDGVSSVFDVLTYNIALVNSTGQIMLLKNPLASDLDLRERIMNAFQELTGQSGTCTLTVCELTDALFNYIGNNIGEVERNTYAGCNSGHNVGEAEGGPVLIDAGNCTSSNLTVTIGDLTAIHSRYLIILMNQVGDLEGDIVLPESSFFEGLRSGGGIGSNSSLDVDNVADVTNNGTSTATSGDNAAYAENTYDIDSGNALAHAFSGTFANQINPPSCFIVSVGGTWNGDIYQIPDGYQRETTSYADVVCGRGKASGELLDNFNIEQKNYAKLLVNAISEAVTGYNTATGKDVTIKSGDAQSFLFILNILNTTLIGQDWMFGLFTVSGDWNGDLTFGARPNASPAEQAAGQIVNSSSGGSGSSSRFGKAVADSKVKLTKTVSASSVTTPSVVEYTLKLVNTGNHIYEAKLRDTLVNPLGTTVGVQTWDLGTLRAGEEVVIKYSIEFKGTLVPGMYTNTARFVGKESATNGLSIKPVIASASLNLIEGEVLGAEDCPAYLSSYISPRGPNDPAQVTLLETFLRDVRGEHIAPDGTYDSHSVEAVERFQKEYENEILAPWGLEDPTGHVFYTTRKTINEINCHGEKEFPLSSLQMGHMSAYRNGSFEPSMSNPTTSWSAADLPLFAQLTGFSKSSYLNRATQSTPLFSRLPFQSFPLLTLLRDIFSSIAQGLSATEAQAQVK